MFIFIKKGSLIKMEDEEGEEFNNTYLTDLMNGGGGGGGRKSPNFNGRESVR